MKDRFERLKSIADVRTGIMGFEYWKMRDIISSDKKIKDDTVKLYTNGNFNRYADGWSQEIKLYKDYYLN